MIALDAEVIGGGSAIAAFAGIPEKLQHRFANTIERHARTTVSIIRTQYRGAGTTSDTATRYGSGKFPAAYHQRTTEITDGAQAEIGLMRGMASEEVLRWGHVHERGATIRPTRAQYLAIPLTAEAQQNEPGLYSGTFVVKSKRTPGNLVVMQRLGKGNVRALYALAKQVTIKARPPGGAINAAFDQVEPALRADLAADVDAVVRSP